MPDTPQHRKLDYPDDIAVSAIHSEVGRQRFREALKLNKDYFDEVVRLAPLLSQQHEPGQRGSTGASGANDRVATEKRT